MRERDGYTFEDSLTQPLQDIIIGDGSERNCRLSEGIRKELTDYFMGEGKLEWQMNMI